MSQENTTPLTAHAYEADVPYPPSWIDRLIQRIIGFPGPSWMYYVATLLIFAFLNNAVRWIDGSLQVGTFLPVRLADAGYLVIPIALYHHLSRVADRSFQAYRTVLKGPDADLHLLKLRLTTLPRRMGWLVFLLGLGLAIASLQTQREAYGIDVAKTLLPLVFLYPVVIVSFSSIFALLLQTIRQLLQVNHLHRRATGINLFQLAPAHALASLTARAGISMIIFIVFSGLTESSNITDLNLILLIVMGILALFVFITPLLGMRNRLVDEKLRLISETNEAIQVTIKRIHDQVNSNDYVDIEGHNTALSALVVERDIIEGISTWPWDPGTLRGFASTLLLPIFLWLVTRLLERLI
jgi:hypothetical protein